jgi:cobalt-zinc-cadmium efflux system membrane fusion protein
LHSHDVHETRAAYESALQDVQQKESALRYQEDLGARLKRLYDLKSASKGEVQRAETDVQSARTDLERAHIAVTKEVAHLTDILRMDPPQLQSIDETTENVPLIAPIAGTVIARNVTLGSVLEPGEEAFVVSDFSTVWMLAAVNERDMGKVSVGRKARVLTDAFPDRAFDGTVTRLGTELDQKTRTLAVRILLSNEKHLLRPGLFSTAQISQGPSRTALFVPELSLQDVNGGSVVFVKTGPDTFEPRSVQLGTRVRGHAEVLAGLKPGAAIAVEGSFAVKSQMLRAQIGE